MDSHIDKCLKLNLGCGTKKLNSYINVDMEKRFNPDKLWDLNILPYPFKSNSAMTIESRYCIEHLESPLHFLKECHRILAPFGMLHIITDNMLGIPYIFNRHKRGFDWRKEHLYAFNKDMLSLLLKRAGFKQHIEVMLVNDYPLRNYRILPKLFCTVFKRFRPRLESWAWKLGSC